MYLFCDCSLECQYEIRIVFGIGRDDDAFVYCAGCSVIGIKLCIDITFFAG